MNDAAQARVLVAHQRAPIQRLLCTNLQADGFVVLGAATPGATLNALRSREVVALVLDAELVKGERPESAELFRFLVGAPLPRLLVSWDPDDWRLARSLRDAPFLSRPDNVDQVVSRVRELVAAGTPAAR